MAPKRYRPNNVSKRKRPTLAEINSHIDWDMIRAEWKQSCTGQEQPGLCGYRNNKFVFCRRPKGHFGVHANAILKYAWHNLEKSADISAHT